MKLNLFSCQGTKYFSCQGTKYICCILTACLRNLLPIRQNQKLFSKVSVIEYVKLLNVTAACRCWKWFQSCHEHLEQRTIWNGCCAVWNSKEPHRSSSKSSYQMQIYFIIIAFIGRMVGDLRTVGIYWASSGRRNFSV